jgi:hypothetical protein
MNDVTALGEWEDRARAFLAEVKAGIDEISLAPATDAERREVFQLKRFGVRQQVYCARS